MRICKRAQRRRKGIEIAESFEPLTLVQFIREFWNILEPTTEYLDNWHIHAIADHLSALTNGDIQKLVINIPPGCMKSLLCCVFWPAWEWSEIDPSSRWLFTSYDGTLSTRDSVKCRRLIQSEPFQIRYSHKFKLMGDQNLKTYFENTKTGFRMSSSVGGTGTGARADRVVCDDPHKVTAAESENVRTGTVEWWATEMSNRGSSPKSIHLVIQQRVHFGDVANWCIENNYETLIVPQEYEGARSLSFLNWSDPRQEDGELLWPARFDEKYIAEQKVSLGSYGYAGQHQQRPVPREGGMVEESWFPRYSQKPKFEQIVLSVDSAYKNKKINDPWAFLAFGIYKGFAYLIDAHRKQYQYPDGKRAIINAVYRTGADTILIEDKASGQALIPDLREEYPGLTILPIKPENDKVTRFSVVTPMIEAGKIYLPEAAPWLTDYLTEILGFPFMPHDDQVDATSQFLKWLKTAANRRLIPRDSVRKI